MGIAGGGIAGLTLAWLLDESHEVLLLEERPRGVRPDNRRRRYSCH
ncbi:NAD(P)-binding protein [Streptomyces sp. SM11]